MQAAGRRPGRVLLAVALAAGVSAALALRLEPSTATETLVGRGSGAYRATEVYRERFGDHAIVVLVRGDLQRLVLTDNLGRLLGLEGCLSGNKPAGRAGARRQGLAVRGVRPHQAGQGRLRPGDVHQLGGRRDQRPVPAAARQQGAGGRAREAGGAQAGRGAGALARPSRSKAAEVGRAARLRAVHARPAPAQPALRARAQGAAADRRPRLRLRARVRPARGATTPKARFAYLFPNARSAVIQVRLKPDLTEAQRRRAIELVRGAVAMKEWRSTDGGSYTGDGRAGGGGGPRGGADGLAAAAARRSPCW